MQIPSRAAFDLLFKQSNHGSKVKGNDKLEDDSGLSLMEVG
jgi:hypothetical protein